MIFEPKRIRFNILKGKKNLSHGNASAEKKQITNTENLFFNGGGKGFKLFAAFCFSQGVLDSKTRKKRGMSVLQFVLLKVSEEGTKRELL